MTDYSRIGIRTGAALLGFLAIGATLHCGAKQEGEVGIDDAGAGSSPALGVSCISGSPNQTGCACSPGQTVACYTGPASTRGVGTCRDGTQTCTAGALNVSSLRLDALDEGDGYGTCTGEVLPAATATCASGGTPAPASCPGPLTKWVPLSTVGAPPAVVTDDPLGLVWTGSEAIVFRGHDASDPDLGDGWLYNPSIDTWREMSATNAPTVRAGASVIWTGTRFIVWGGVHESTAGMTPLDDGGIYDPVTDTWVAIPSAKSLGLAEGPTAGQRQIAWTGTELVIFGGVDRDGWFYNPATQGWRTFGSGPGALGRSLTNIPSIDTWTGSAAVVWGDALNPSASGAVFHDAANMWEPISAAPIAGRVSADSVLAGLQIFVHGGVRLESPEGIYSDGAMYDPVADVWTLLPAGGGARLLGDTVWTGCDVLEIGGFDAADDAASTGMRYTPATGTWSALPALPEPFFGDGAGAVWAGDQLIAFANGGTYAGGVFSYRLVQ